MNTNCYSLICGAFLVGILPACAATPAGSDVDDEDLAGESREEALTTSIVLDASPNKPAFIHVADLNGDGFPEIIVSAFDASGPFGGGRVNIYRQKTPGNISSWTKEMLPGSKGTKFPNSVSTHDIDGDGDLDIVVPSGFLACAPGSCGALAWYERTSSGWTKRSLLSGKSLFYHHVEHVDMNGDGVKDLVTVGEKKGIWDDGSAEVHLFTGNATSLRFAKTPIKLATGLGSIPTVMDLDKDGDLDIASAEYFGSNGSFAWLENTGSLTSWSKHYMDNTSGKAIQLSLVPNLFGDGKLVGIGANHTNTKDNPSSPESAVFLLAKPNNPTLPWTKTQISTGIQSVASPAFGPQGAPGVFAYGDPDGDGDIDIVVHGDGDPRVFVLEQTAPGVFTTNILASNFNQGGVAVADLDGDGMDEIIASSYEKNRLEIFLYNR
ncbi:MAG: FG-GAP-like repeat-containing protein [Polyangiaceae bacterium]